MERSGRSDTSLTDLGATRSWMPSALLETSWVMKNITLLDTLRQPLAFTTFNDGMKVTMSASEFSLMLWHQEMSRRSSSGQCFWMAERPLRVISESEMFKDRRDAPTVLAQRCSSSSSPMSGSAPSSSSRSSVQWAEAARATSPPFTRHRVTSRECRAC